MIKKIKKIFQRFESDNKVYIIPTIAGIYFGLIYFAMLIVSISYGNQYGYIILFLMLSLYLVSCFTTNFNLVDIEIKNIDILDSFAGSKNYFKIALKNHKSLKSSINIKFNGVNIINDIDLKEKSTSKKSIKLLHKKRGCYKKIRIEINTSFPFGVFYSWKIYNSKKEFYVYPEPIDNSIEPKKIKIKDLFKENLENFDSIQNHFSTLKYLRNYQDGDSLSRISWKNYWREMKLNVKEFSNTNDYIFIFDMNHLSHLSLENKLSQISFWIKKAIEKNYPFFINIDDKKGVVFDKSEAKEWLRLISIYDYE